LAAQCGHNIPGTRHAVCRMGVEWRIHAWVYQEAAQSMSIPAYDDVTALDLRAALGPGEDDEDEADDDLDEDEDWENEESEGNEEA